jgi:hypothetical protein
MVPGVDDVLSGGVDWVPLVHEGSGEGIQAGPTQLMVLMLMNPTRLVLS